MEKGLLKDGDRVLAHYEVWFGKGTSSSKFNYDELLYVDDCYHNTKDPEIPLNGPTEFVIGQRTPKDKIYRVGDSIEGFDQEFKTMKVGEVREIYIPSKLAYGEEGASSFHTFFGYRIAPGRGIRCKLELVAINE